MINIIEFEEEPFRRHIKTTFVTDNTESNSRTAKTTVSTIISDIHLPEINPNRFNVIVNNNLRERYFGDLDGKDLIYYNKVWPVDMVRFEFYLSYVFQALIFLFLLVLFLLFYYIIIIFFMYL